MATPITHPSPNGSNGRASNGQFGKGNPGGPGNPRAKTVAILRSMLLDAVTENDIRAVVQMLVAKAKDGDIPAARELLNRIFGKPINSLEQDRIDLERKSLHLRERQVEVAEDRI